MASKQIVIDLASVSKTVAEKLTRERAEYHLEEVLDEYIPPAINAVLTKKRVRELTAEVVEENVDVIKKLILEEVSDCIRRNF